jgi:hypothetical protein
MAQSNRPPESSDTMSINQRLRASLPPQVALERLPQRISRRQARRRYIFRSSLGETRRPNFHKSSKAHKLHSQTSRIPRQETLASYRCCRPPLPQLPQLVLTQPDLDAVRLGHPSCIIPESLLRDGVAHLPCDCGNISAQSPVFITKPASRGNIRCCDRPSEWTGQMVCGEVYIALFLFFDRYNSLICIATSDTTRSRLVGLGSASARSARPGGPPEA